MKSLSDDALLRCLCEVVRHSRRAEADVIEHIAEVDARRLYAREAMPSMFAYCTEVLHLSEPEAGLRIHVARACREHSLLLGMLRDGRLHLSGIAVLAPHLTPGNRDALLKRAIHQSKRRIEEIVAELKPRPEAPAVVRKVPVRERRAPATAGRPYPEGPPRAAGAVAAERCPDSTVSGSSRDGMSDFLHRPDDVAALPPPAPAPASKVTPVAPARFRVHFTASAELRDKLERLQALMRASVPDGDLGKVLDQAVTHELERLEAKRFGKTKAPRKTPSKTSTKPTSRHIPAAVRRAVHERDKGRCTYVDRLGRRCQARDRLEFHHHGKPFGLGGDHSPKNVRLMCRTHNALMAEKDYGTRKMAQYRRRRSPGTRVSEAVAVYGSGPTTRGLARSPG